MNHISRRAVITDSISCLLAGLWLQQGAVVRDIRASIEQFLNDPLGDNAASCMADIVKFAMVSPVVSVEFSKKYTPWSGEEGSHENDILTAGYVAGNVRAQLDVGYKGNDYYSGIVQSIRVYRVMRERLKYSNQSMERYVGLAEKGVLLREFCL